MEGSDGADKPVIRPVRVEVDDTKNPVPDHLPWIERIREIVETSEAPFLDGLRRWLTVTWSPSNSDLLGVTRFELDPNELMRRKKMKAPSGPVQIQLHPILVDDQALLEHTFVHELLHAAGLTTHNLRHSELTEALAPAPSLSDSPVLQRLRSAVIDGQHVQHWTCNHCNFTWERSTVARPKRCPNCARAQVVPYE